MELIKKYEIALKEICTKYSNKYENYINFILLENPEISLKNESCEFEINIETNNVYIKENVKFIKVKISFNTGSARLFVRGYEFEPLIKSNTTISKVIDSVFEKYENIFSEIMEYEKYRDTEEN